MQQLELFPRYRALPANMFVTVEPWGFPVTVVYDYDEGEPATWDHPGAEPYCVILEAHVGGVDIYDMLENEQILRLEEAVLRAMGVR